MRPPRVLSTLVLLAIVDLALRVFGFARVLKVARRIAPVGADVQDVALLHETLKAIVMATAFYPGRSQCLEQTIAGFVLLRRRGFDVRVRLGVQPYPFAAHAWLEHAGKPLTESDEVVARFALLPEVAA